ncbi:MAG TPA: mannonate dehydratase [Saprospiraceae bacterium]|nr:mannonate dehydratase [Saprospiraceae bacterium]
MRWFGPGDPVSLNDVAQAGCTGVVSALHHVPVGKVWTTSEIKKHQSIIQDAGLEWKVVESLPVHEEIKSNSGGVKMYIENYKESIRNLGLCGIEVVTYNFMPALDWVRTHVNFKLSNGAETLKFDKVEYAIFDLFILSRPGAEKDYSSDELKYYKERFDHLSPRDIERIKKALLMALPGSEIPFTLSDVLELLSQYQQIRRENLQNNLFIFLEEIIPVAEEAGIKMAIHPDDPPFPVLGLPRILSTNTDVMELMTAIPSIANGLCFCTGSFGARKDNHLLEMLRNWGSKTYFFHLRNTSMDDQGNFIEANHLEGDADMYSLMREIVQLMQREQRSIPMRPDHGHKILDDLNKETYPGYSAIGRLKGLAELNGLEYALQREWAESVHRINSAVHQL